MKTLVVSHKAERLIGNPRVNFSNQNQQKSLSHILRSKSRKPHCHRPVMPRSCASISSPQLPFHSWKQLTTPPTEPPVETYGPANKSWITLRISHGGNLIDMPRRNFRYAKVAYFEDVDVNSLNLGELHNIERHLGYTTVGKWYCVNHNPNANTDSLLLHTERHISSFVESVKWNKLQHIEQLYVEYVDSSEIVILPKNIMENSEKRVEKLVYVLFLENPKASIYEAIGFVLHMIGVVVPVSKIEKLIRQAKENLKNWRNG